MIAGDTVFGDEVGGLTPPPEMYCLDVEEATREINRLLDYDFEALLITHGKKIMKNAKKTIEELCEKTS
jgi:glyoxylase-like metal-dependent hydrolase (beta-lactamase superfamily II)